MNRPDKLCPNESAKLKTKKRRIRLAKKGIEKILKSYHTELLQIKNKQWKREPIELEYPIRQGWRRYFIMRDNMKKKPDAVFFETLLDKINTYEFSRNKRFEYPKRRIRIYKCVNHCQELKSFWAYEFESKKNILTDKEKLFFEPRYRIRNGQTYIEKHVFTQPWRYQLKVAAHFVTHVYELNTELESKKKQIENHLIKNGLDHKMYKYINGSVRYKRNNIETNPFKNKPFTSMLEVYEEQKQLMADITGQQ